MCLNPRTMSITPRFSTGQRMALVPCGRCIECRIANKNSWSFRIGAEFQKKQALGWLVGFGTLTYDDDHLPHVPDVCFEKVVNGEIVEIPHEPLACFSRKHARTFIDNLRKRLFDLNSAYTDDNKLVYFLASEYGSSTQRPHYHFMLCWNPNLGCSAEKMFELVNENWNHGFIFPRYINGGFDGKYWHKPFIVQASSLLAARYAAKYVCKDVSYIKYHKDVNTKVEAYKDCKYFHIQSKSIGFSVLSGLSDDEKIRLLVTGFSFDGEQKFIEIPVYVKNKLIFDNRYIYYNQNLQEVDKKYGVKMPYNWKRVVQREASNFFKDYRDEILKAKSAIYEKVFYDFMDSSFLLRYGFYKVDDSPDIKKCLDDNKAVLCAKIENYFSRFGASFINDYLAYGCRAYDNCYNVGYGLAYLSRYCEYDFKGAELISIERWQELQDIIKMYYRFMSTRPREPAYSENDLILMEIDDFYRKKELDYVF